MGKKVEVSREVLFYAFRYALGRMSYAPSTVMDTIKENINDLSSWDIRSYIKEISECEHYGAEMDERHWLEFKGYLENEINQRLEKEGD